MTLDTFLSHAVTRLDDAKSHLIAAKYALWRNWPVRVAHDQPISGDELAIGRHVLESSDAQGDVGTG